MAVIESTSSRESESDSSVQFRDMTDTSGSDSLFTRFLTRVEPVVGRSKATWFLTRFSSRGVKAQPSNGLERTLNGGSSVSPGAVPQAMLSLAQANLPESGAGQEGFDPVNKGHEEELSESPNGESGEIAGGKIMGETTLAEVATTVTHQGETLVRMESKIDGNFKWLLAIMLSGFGALGLVVIGTPYVQQQPASVAPQNSPGGYTLTVHPYPPVSSTGAGTAPSAKQTPVSSD